MRHAPKHIFIFLVFSTLWGQDALVWPEKSTPSFSERVAILEDRRLKECSGLCLSGRDPSIFWTLNDSGGEPCIFAIDQSGKTRAKVRLRDAANFDWEDIASGKDEKGRPALFIGDIGDNFLIRTSLQVYQIPEPEIMSVGNSVAETETAAPVLWRANYPDGKHNAESLFVHPRTNQIHILTKSEDGKSALYAFPVKRQQNGSMTLEKIIDLTFPAMVRMGKRPHDNCMTTSADFAPDGTRMVVSTYSSLYEWPQTDDRPLKETLRQPPIRIEPEVVSQLEGVCYGADSKTIWYISERLPTPLMRVRR